MPPPWFAELPLIVLVFSNHRATIDVETAAAELAKLPLKVTFVSVGLPLELNIPPPKLLALLPLKSVLVTFG
jgi:hypothetical protein